MEYFTGYSFEINLSPEERHWFERFLTKYVAMCDDNERFGYQLGEGSVWFYSPYDEGELSTVAEVVCRFLHHWRPDQAVLITYACWASRPTPGAYFGGVAIVCGNEVEYIHADVVARQRVRERNLHLSM